MSIPMDAACFQCHFGRYLATARKHGDEQRATAFAKDLMRVYLELPEGSSSPELGPAVTELLQKHYGLEADRLRREKEESNRFVLERLDAIRREVREAEEPLYRALQVAVLGNYLDFSALQGKVSFQQLEEMLRSAQELNLDRGTYEQFCRDLQKGKQVLILTDNAGEIGFDRVFAEEMAKAWPHLEITFCVRGGPAHNDATREDAAIMQIPFPVIDSGCCIGGTVLEKLSPEAKEAMDRADVILAKGMGNTETLYGCGYPVYYAFLVKCDRVMRYFDRPMMTPMFIKDPNCQRDKKAANRQKAEKC